MLVAAPDGREIVLAGEGLTLTGFAAEQSVALTRFAYLLCGDRFAAEDLVQDTFLGLYRRFGDELPVSAPVAYARRAVLNAHLSRSRRRANREIVTNSPPEVAVGCDGGRRGDEVPGDGDLWDALSKLAGRQRAVLVLRYYLDLTDAAIAAELGCREGSVRSLATRAFAALRADPSVARSIGRTRNDER